MNLKNKFPLFSLLMISGTSLLLHCSFASLSDPADAIVLTPDDLKLSEVMTSNSTTLTDQFNETPDWIELYNSGDTAIDLAGYGLSDNLDNPGKWTCGSMLLSAKDYAVICASGNDITAFEPEKAEDIDMMATAIGAWADSQFVPKGKSFVRAMQFSPIVFGVVDGKKIISAKMYLDDNAGVLTWRSAQVTMDLLQTKNYSSFDKIRVIGTIEKGKRLMVRICQLGVENSYTFGQVLIGTGRENDSFDLPIAHEPRLNRAAITGFLFSPDRVNDTITFSITGLKLITTALYMHTDFKLSADGETLLLTSRAGKIIDLHKLQPLLTDLSQGIKDSDLSSWIVFDYPTPGAPNKPASFTGVVAPLTTSTEGGFFTGPVRLTLASDLAQIFFSTDGSLPTTTSLSYTSPVTLQATTVMRYRGFSQNFLPSAIETNTYFINDRSDLAIVSIAVEPGLLFDPDTGIYMKGPLASDTIPYFGANFWLDKEVPAHIEFFEPDGRRGFKTNIGLRIFGNYSRMYPKKSLAILFKNEYGQGSLNYPLFPDFPSLTKFQSFLLRNNGSNFQKAMFEDALAGALTTGLDIDFQKYRPSVVYINGQYWGIQNIREKLNTGYITGNHGYLPEEIEFIKAYGDLEAGDKNHYNEMLQYMKSYDLSLPAHYDYIATQMDIDNYITYVTAEIYYANTDWPANNNGWWRPKTATGKWRWIIYDVDGGFGSWGQAYDTNMVKFATDSLGPEWPNPPWSTFILRTLLKNSEFKRRFINRAATLLSTNFETATVNAQIERMAAVIRTEIPRDFARWETPVSQWEANVTKLKNWARYRPDGMLKNYTDFFTLDGTARLTLTTQGNGRIDIDGITIKEYPFTGTYFIGNPVLITAVPGSGSFKQWSDGVTDRERMVDMDEDLTLEAIFE